MMSIGRSIDSEEPLAAKMSSSGWPPFMVIAYIISVLVPISVKLGPVAMTSVRLTSLLFLVPLLIRLFSGKAGRVNLIDVFFLMHLGWATLALAMNNPNRFIEQSGAIGLEFIGGYLVARVCIRNRDVFVATAKLLIAVVVCFVPFAIYETLTGHSLILQIMRTIPLVQVPADIEIGKRLGLNRVQLTFVHPIHFGLFCSITVPLCLVALRDQMAPTKRWSIGVLLCATGFLALSSGAILAIALQLGLLTWALILRDVSQRWWILLGLFATTYVVIDLLSNRSAMMVFLSYATFSTHTAYWRTLIFQYAMENVWANPVFGLGLNDWLRPRWMYSGSMDNFWLVMAVKYGIPGFFLIASGYLVGLFSIMFRDFSRDNEMQNLRLSWVFTIVGLTFTLCTVHVWHAIFSFVFFIFGAGLWMRDEPNHSSREPKPAEHTDDALPQRFTRFATASGKTRHEN